jgi:carbamoyl-phosphate synthase large subunit
VSEIRVLVTSAGSAPAAAVIKALRRATDWRLEIGAVDMAPHAVGFCLADWAERIPAARDPSFVERLLEVVRRRRVEYVFPIIDEELPVWAAHAETFAREGVRVFTNPLACVEIANDKRSTAAHCAARSLAHPRTMDAAEALALGAEAYPLFAKPAGGRGSIGAARIPDRESLRRHLADRPDDIVQSCLEGREFTVDVLTNPGGKIVALVPKERLEVKSGMATKSATRTVPEVAAFTEKVVAAFGVRGVANVQVMLTRDGPVLIEVNPKFATSLPLTVAAGANLPALLIALARGEWNPVEKIPYRSDLLLLRCWDDHVVALDA